MPRRQALTLLAGSLAPACSRSRPPATGGGTSAVSAVDSRGVRVVLERPAQRIVCLIESALTGLYMLGADGALVGVSTNVYDGPAAPYYAALDPRLRERRLPAPGNWDFISTESVAALAPDLVILWAEQRESIAALERIGIPCYGVFLRSLADLEEEIRSLAELTGCGRRAGEILARARGELEEIDSRVRSIPAERRPRAYFAWSQGLLETSGGVGLVQELLSRAGTTNVCASLPQEHAVVDAERLIQWNPEIIVLWGDERRSPGDVLGDARFQRIEAVRNGRIHELPDVFLADLWTLKLAHTVRLVASWAHPSLLPRSEIRSKRDRFFADLYGGRLPPRLLGEQAVH